MACTASADPRHRRAGNIALCVAALSIWSTARADDREAATRDDQAPAATIGVLPVAGAVDSHSASRLAESLAASLQQRMRGRRLLGPIAIGRRLAAHPRTTAALKRLQDQLRAAADATLQMNRGAALQATTAARQAANAALAALHAPPAMVQLHLSRALALLLEPADPAAARRAFVAALAIDPHYRPGGGGLAPRAERLLQQARETARTAHPATALSRAEVAAVAQRARLTQLVQVTIEPAAPGRGPVVSVTAALISSSGRRTAVRQTLAVPSGAPDSEQLTPMVAGLLGFEHAAPGRGDTVVARPGRGRRRSAAGVPWYRRWWVWTAAGAVLAGAAVGLAVGLTRGGDDSSRDQREPVTLRVEFK